MILAGLDIGTTGCKITLYNSEGIYLYRSYCDYPVSRNAGEHEVEAEFIWESVKQVISDATKKYPDIEAIGISSFGETFIMLDENNQPIRPALLYTDPRGKDESNVLIKKLGSERIRRIIGVNPHSMYSLPKIMWIKKHFPDEYKKVHRILLMEDFIIYMLTGNAVIDYSLAARSMAFDIKQLKWSDELLGAAGVDKELFSRTVISGTDAGSVKKQLADRLGLTNKTKIIPVGHDQVAAAIGAGVLSKEMAVDGAGTVECITPVFDEIPSGDQMYDGNYAIIPYVIPGKYVTYAFSFTGGALIAWYVENLAKGVQYQAQEQNKSVFEILEGGMRDEPSKILVLPHFAGAATPYMDKDAKGVVIGLTLEHNVSDLYRAMMEGVVYEMLLNIEHLKAAGIVLKQLRATGGGAASKVWMQMKADILNIPIAALDNAEAGAVGCVMMAGIAVGCFKDLQEAAEKLIHEKEIYYPRAEKYQKYQKYYAKYRNLYEAVRPLM